MIWHSESVAAVLTHLRTDRDNGLTTEAVEEYQKEHTGRPVHESGDSFGARFLNCLTRPAVLVLLAVSLLAIGLAAYAVTKYRPADFVTPSALIALTLVRCVVGALGRRQPTDASFARSVTAATRVRRNGEWLQLSADELVPGDIIEVTAGDIVPADCRLLSSFELHCDESLLTDDFLPVTKDAAARASSITPLAKRANMLYADCPVLQGQGLAVVVEVGNRTARVQRARTLKPRGREFPQQQMLAKAAQTLSSVALLLGAITAIVGIVVDLSPINALLLGLALAVSLMPEELTTLAPSAWRFAMRRLAKHGSVVADADAMNTLGEVNVLVADKNGLFTQNNMTLIRSFAGGRMVKMDQNRTPKDLNSLLQLALLCTDKEDPSSPAIADYLNDHGDDPRDLIASYPQVAYAAPTDLRRRAVSVHLIEGQYIVVVKGAPEEVLPLCGDSPDGVAAAEEFMTAEALRTYAVAYKTIAAPPSPFLPEELEQGVAFLGLLGFADPPHEDTAAAVAECLSAGIRPILFTGDSLAAARATARRIGLLTDTAQGISGEELAAMSDEELAARLPDIRVCARATAADKLRLVTAWRARGATVAATAITPACVSALGAANIGIAVTDDNTSFSVAAELTLQNARLSAITQAIAAARAAIDALRHAVSYRIASGLATVALVIASLIFGKGLPLPAALLVLGGTVISLLSRPALVREPAGRAAMRRAPRTKQYDVFKNATPTAVLQGILLTLITVIALATEGAGTAFAAWAIGHVLLLWSARSSQPLLRSRPFACPWVWISGILMLLLFALLMYLPALQMLYAFPPATSVSQLLLILLAAYVLITEAAKWLLAILRRR